MEDWSDTELAYLAGIVDGEGTLNIYRRDGYSPVGNAYDYFLNVGNTDLNLIQWLRDRFGGNFVQYDNRYEGGRRKSWKPMYRVTWNEKSHLANLLSCIYDFLIVKRELAEKMLSFLYIPREEVDMRTVAYDNFKKSASDSRNNGRLYAEDLVAIGTRTAAEVK